MLWGPDAIVQISKTGVWGLDWVLREAEHKPSGTVERKVYGGVWTRPQPDPGSYFLEPTSLGL